MHLKSSCQSFAAVVRLVVALSLTGAIAGSAEEANETEAASTNQPALSVDVRRDIEGTYVPYRYAFVTSGSEKYTFLVPDSYRVDTSDPAKVKLASADFSAMIVLGLASGIPAGAKMDAATLQARVLANYPEATINAEQTMCANGQTAPALDFTWKADTGVTRKSRTTFIPVAGGLLEFTLTASPDKFEATLSELNLVLLTFRSGVNGKFDYVIGSKYP